MMLTDALALKVKSVHLVQLERFNAVLFFGLFCALGSDPMNHVYFNVNINMIQPSSSEEPLGPPFGTKRTHSVPC